MFRIEVKGSLRDQELQRQSQGQIVIRAIRTPGHSLHG